MLKDDLGSGATLGKSSGLMALRKPQERKGLFVVKACHDQMMCFFARGGDAFGPTRIFQLRRNRGGAVRAASVR